MSISKEEILHIANLSKLYIEDSKIEKYTNDLSGMVDLANSLGEIDVNEVNPTNHILDIKNVFRKDEVSHSSTREDILKNAPDSQGGCISVPKVVE